MWVDGTPNPKPLEAAEATLMLKSSRSIEALTIGNAVLTVLHYNYIKYYTSQSLLLIVKAPVVVLAPASYSPSIDTTRDPQTPF